MRIYIAGEGAREAYLTELAKAHGHEVNGTGPWDVVILQLPRSGLSGDLSGRLPRGQKIVCGQIGPELERLAREKGWRLLPILKDEIFTQENAVLTAEGAIFAAMRQADFSVSGADCLVVGYGRIGKALTEMLRGLGAKVTVAARREESRREAGINSADTASMEKALSSARLIFNTVPSPLIGKAQLAHVQPDSLLIELASAPYGIDLASAQEMGLRAWLESGVPGRYCPCSAARAMLNFVERSERHE